MISMLKFNEWMNERFPTGTLKHRRVIINVPQTLFSHWRINVAGVLLSCLEYRYFVDGLITRKYSNLCYL